MVGAKIDETNQANICVKYMMSTTRDAVASSTASPVVDMCFAEIYSPDLKSWLPTDCPVLSSHSPLFVRGNQCIKDQDLT